jgi:hypothetical protein
VQLPYEGKELSFGGLIPPWVNDGRRLWSLAEMIFWASTNFVGMWGSVHKHIGILETLIAGNPAARGAFLSPPMRANIATFVAGYADQECKHLGLDISAQNARSMKMRIEQGHPYTAAEMLAELTLLMQTMIQELAKRKLACIPPPHDQFFQQEKLFGESVFQAFPSVDAEIKAAGNALAADLGTAAVFYLMRIAERGMRVLAWDRRVSVVRNKPLELQQWKDILDGVQAKVDLIVNWPNTLGLAKTQAEEFYNGALGEFRGFKDAWRNHVMHDRRSYSFDEAKAIMTHVERFMKTLATRISESKRTPLRWTKKQVLAIP